MLVLTREIDEFIDVTATNGERIEICLLSLRCNKKARIGITAPEGVTINRREIQEVKDREAARESA